MAMTSEAAQACRYLAGCPRYGNTTLTKKDTQSLLLETGGNMLARGSLYNIKTQDLGADIYRVSLELAHP